MDPPLETLDQAALVVFYGIIWANGSLDSPGNELVQDVYKLNS